VALVHHDQAVAVLDGILHVVGDHHGGQVVFLHNLGREGQHLERRLGVQSGGVLIQQQELGLVHGSGEEKKNLHVSDLLAKFQIASGGEFANDRMILS